MFKIFKDIKKVKETWRWTNSEIRELMWNYKYII